MCNNKIDIHTGRHSLAHVLAKAVTELFEDVKLAIGPAIDTGFYYDFDMKHVITEDDFKNIEKRMLEIVNRHENFTKKMVGIDDALKLFKNQPYKLELIEGLKDKGEDMSVYYLGDDFYDLCRGPHVDNTKDLKNWSFKISNVAGAYWHGDEKNKMLQRVYVYAYPSKAELKEYLNFVDEAKKRDHRKLGPQLDLFFMDETAPGMPYWLPDGWKMFNILIDFWREEHEKRGYHEISSPLVNRDVLWKTSGHWAHYKENMFAIPLSEEQNFAVKPMNCPNAMVVYGRKTRSYRDLPLRFSDCDVLHRKEGSGTLHGLMRVQMFRQDDSHNFITEDQISSEINSILDIADLFYSIFGLTYSPVLSTRPKDFMGDIALWDKAEAELKSVLDARYGKDGYKINEGDGAFYGPKIDIMMKDALNRVWQTGTIQLDFQLSRNFNLTYTDKDGKQKIPVVIHRVIYGSMERFIGILIEHFAGKFPFWISANQIGIVPVRDEHIEYADKIAEKLRMSKLRVTVDKSEGTMGNKIKSFRKKLFPYIIIVGDKEIENGTVSVRVRTGKQINNISVDSFINECKKMVDNHSLDLTEEF
ncbi:MAG: threonine--tRNA ligase [Acutalibacteraceae bacterium]